MGRLQYPHLSILIKILNKVLTKSVLFILGFESDSFHMRRKYHLVREEYHYCGMVVLCLDDGILGDRPFADYVSLTRNREISRHSMADD